MTGVLDPHGVAIAERRGPASWAVECSCTWTSAGHLTDLAALQAHAAHAGTTYETPSPRIQARGGVLVG